MPNLDKSGPRGEGSKTGRGQGDCSPKNTQFVNGQGRRGRMCRWSKGFGLSEDKQFKQEKTPTVENK